MKCFWFLLPLFVACTPAAPPELSEEQQCAQHMAEVFKFSYDPLPSQDALVESCREHIQEHGEGSWK